MSNFLSVADEDVPDAVRRLSGEKDELKHLLKLWPVLLALVLCTASLVDASYNPFLYFRF